MADPQLNFDEANLDPSTGLYDLYSRLYEGIKAANQNTPPDYTTNPPMTEAGEVDMEAIKAGLENYGDVSMKNFAYTMAGAIISAVGSGGGGGGGGGTPDIDLSNYATIKYVDDEIGKVTKQGLLFDIYNQWEAVLQKTFPLTISLAASSPTSEYTATAKTFNLTWTCKREGVGILPSNVKVTQDGTVIYDGAPGSSSGTISVSVLKKGTTQFQITITAEGVTKSTSASHSRVLPIFYGFSSKDTLENMKGNLEKYIAANFNVTKTINNSVEGGHLVIALPDGKKISTIKSGGFDVPMSNPITDTYNVGGTDYSYNVYYSSNPINLGNMTIEVKTN